MAWIGIGNKPTFSLGEVAKYLRCPVRPCLSTGSLSDHSTYIVCLRSGTGCGLDWQGAILWPVFSFRLVASDLGFVCPLAPPTACPML